MTTVIHRPDKMHYKLPAHINTGIGKIAVRWSFLEASLQTTIWNLAQVTHPFGRVAIRQPRLDDRLAMIEDLAMMRGIELNESEISKLRAAIKKIAPKRDALVHGYWTKYKRGWCVTNVRGTWSKDVPHPRKKTIVPESLIVTKGGLAVIREEIEAAIDLGRSIARSVLRELLPPPEVHPLQFPRKNPKRDRAQQGP